MKISARQLPDQVLPTAKPVGLQPEAGERIAIRLPHPPKGDQKTQGRDNRKSATVSWYGNLLIISVLLVAAGWELFRWMIAIITLD